MDHTIPSNLKKARTNERHPLEIIFTLVVLVSTFFTSVAGILALFGSDRNRKHPNRFAIAVMVLQGIASLLCLVAALIACRHDFDIPNESSRAPRKGRPVSFAYTPQITAILEGVILFIVNGICLAMAIIILSKREYTSDIFNGIYNGTAIIGACILVLLTSFPIHKHCKKQDRHQPQNSRALTLSEHWTQMQQKQRQQNPVPNNKGAGVTALAVV